MSYRSFLRSVAVVSSAALVLGAFGAVPADAKKKKKKAACAAYVPSEWGAGEPINIITDAQTADAPFEVELDVPAGVGSSSSDSPDGGDGPSSHVFVNVQVDSKAPTAGLYGQLSYDIPVEDYDLWFRDNSGAGLAASAGFAPGVPLLDGTGSGGHTGLGSENIDGLSTTDCQGLLVDVVGATTPGGTVTLKLWLGEIQYTPGG